MSSHHARSNRALIAVLAAFAVETACATIVATGPFDGAYSEAFEGFPSGIFAPSPSPVMGGIATLASPDDALYIFEPGALFPFDLDANGIAQPSDGTKGLGVDAVASTTTLSFSVPMQKFGAYWGFAAGLSGSVTVEFYAPGSVLVGTDSFSYARPGDGVLEWQGWQSDASFTMVVFTGDYIAVDGLEAVPEPASAVAVGVLLLGGVVGWRRGWWRRARGLVAALAVLASTCGGWAATPATGDSAPPWLQTMIDNLVPEPSPMRLPVDTLALNGFNDRLNSYAWAMGELNGDMYVGTGRYVDTFHPMWERIWGAINPGTLPPYPPDMPSGIPFLREWLGRTPDGLYVVDEAKFNAWSVGSRAEIWRIKGPGKPGARVARVFQGSFVPAILEDPALDRPQSFRFTAANVMGFRSMAAFTDQQTPSHTSLFAFTGGFSFGAPRFSPLIYRSDDGRRWLGVPTPPAMGRETRASTVHNGKLYVGTGTTAAAGSGADPSAAVWCVSTAVPTQASDWVKVIDFNTVPESVVNGSPNSGIVSLASFHGKLYIGTENIGGYQVWAGDPDATTPVWTMVVKEGASDRFNAWAATMMEFGDYLYVGSIGLPALGGGYMAVKGFDLIRIDDNNMWQVMVGGRRPVDPPPAPPNQIPSNPTWPSGFGNPLNFYCWSMVVHQDQLYVGTFDATSVVLSALKGSSLLPSEFDPVLDFIAAVTGGADLWATPDGDTWIPLALRGITGFHNYGIRNLKEMSGRLYIGTANPFDGCQVLTP